MPDTSTRMLSVDEALSTLLSYAKEIEETEEVPLIQANSRITSEELFAKINVPGFDRSAMDGYALKFSSIEKASKENPVALDIVDEIFAGSPAKTKIEKNTCAYIATGAKIPPGADTVVMIEDTVTENKTAVFKKPASRPGENIALIGEDIKKDSKILEKGVTINPATIGAMAALGMISAKVYRKPVCAVISTGSELREPGEELEEGQIYNINSYTLEALLQNSSVYPYPQIVRDKEKDVIKGINDCLFADLIIISGGSSVGKLDIAAKVIHEISEVIFHGIYMKPGKPTIFARLKNSLILGMPGNPTSCLFNTYKFIIPMLQKMARKPALQNKQMLRLTEDVTKTTDRHQFVTVSINGDEATPIFKTSSAITSMLRADGYMELADDIKTIKKGETASITKLQ